MRNYVDIPEQDELVDIADVNLEGSVITVTITDIPKTHTQTFGIIVRG